MRTQAVAPASAGLSARHRFVGKTLGRRRLRAMVVAGLAVVAAVAFLVARGGSPRGVPPRVGPNSWRLIFDATFTGRSLNTALWHTCYDFGACQIVHNGEYEWYVPHGVAVRGGTLVLTARAHKVHGQPLSSGMIQSNGRFDFEYGYVEIRAKVPSGFGTWPALWLLPEDGQWPPEIDIMEYWGWSPNQIRESLFPPGDKTGLHHTVDVPHITAGYHTYAVDWEPHEISWYVDGQLEYQLHDSIAMPMYPIANLAASAPPTGPASRTFPASFEVQYIRVYQHPGVGKYQCVGGCTVPNDADVGGP